MYDIGLFLYVCTTQNDKVMTALINTALAEFKQLLRMNDIKGDPWGVAMGAWFDCAAHLYEKGDCPHEWQYRPGWAGNHIDEDSVYFDLFNEASADTLEEIGRYLYRITEALRRKGRDY